MLEDMIIIFFNGTVIGVWVNKNNNTLKGNLRYFIELEYIEM